MKPKNCLWACLLCLCAMSSFGQAQPTDKSYIAVTGVAEKEVTPDEIYIRITLAERYEGKDKIEIPAQEATMMATLKALGINMADITLSAADEVYRKTKKLGRKDVMAKREYEVKVSTAEMAGRLLDTLEDMKVKEASISRFDYSKRTEIKKELLMEAMRAAQNKADYMLQAIGHKAGRPLFVEEGDVEPGFYINAAEVSNSIYKENSPYPVKNVDDLEVRLSPGSMRFKFSVNVRFQIE